MTNGRWERCPRIGTLVGESLDLGTSERAHALERAGAAEALGLLPLVTYHPPATRASILTAPLAAERGCNVPDHTLEDDYSPDVGFDPEDLVLVIRWRMPFGRYAGRALIDLPEEYLLWFERRGFPDGDLGRLLSITLGIKRHGAEPVVRELRRRMETRQ